MSDSMDLDRQLFILGDPIETQFGTIRFLSYTEYLKNLQSLTTMGMNVLHFYNQYKELTKMIPAENKAEFNEMLENMKKSSLYEIIANDENLSDAYFKIFKMVLVNDDDEKYKASLEKIFDDEKLFMAMRNLVMDMNFVTEDPVSDNPEIQEYYLERKKQKAREAGKQTVSDIVTSIVAGSSNSFSDIRNWTVIQVYSMYYRIAAFKGYDTSILFATVGSDAKIESWSKNIDLFEDQALGINYEDFNKKYGGLFD